MSKHIEIKMAKKGYKKVQGMAILNDVAVTETHREILTPTLNTQQAVDIFNNEFCDDWQLYRKVENKTTGEHNAN